MSRRPRLAAWCFAAALMPLVVSCPRAAGPIEVIERPLYRQGLAEHLRTDPGVPPGAVLLIGDSIVHNIPADLTPCPHCVNYGIVGDTTAGMRARLPRYASLPQATTVVLEGGINDLPFGRGFDTQIVDNYRAMLQAIPTTARVLLVGILPVDETAPFTRPGWTARIAHINQALTALCLAQQHCTRVEAHALLAAEDGNLRPDFHGRDDGVHLSRSGYAAWLPVLHAALAER